MNKVSCKLTILVFWCTLNIFVWKSGMLLPLTHCSNSCVSVLFQFDLESEGHKLVTHNQLALFLFIYRAEEPSQPKEPSVSQKELTPPKPVQPSVSSPSSLSSTTLGTTATITTEEEISEGELIQVSAPPSPPFPPSFSLKRISFECGVKDTWPYSSYFFLTF